MAFDFILAMKSNQKRRIFGLVFKSQFLKMFVTTMIIVNARLFAGSFTHCVKLNTLVLNSSNTPQVSWWCALEINTAVSTIHFAQLHSLTLRQKFRHVEWRLLFLPLSHWTKQALSRIVTPFSILDAVLTSFIALSTRCAQDSPLTWCWKGIWQGGVELSYQHSGNVWIWPYVHIID